MRLHILFMEYIFLERENWTKFLLKSQIKVSFQTSSFMITDAFEENGLDK